MTTTNTNFKVKNGLDVAGNITITGTPSASNHATTKQYVDTASTGIQNQISTLIPATEKGAANGVATLGADSKVPATQLPSYVDDVLEYANLAALPAVGETAKIYVALDTNKIYRWSGSVYIEISPTAGNADTATKLATARTIDITGDISYTSPAFDGSSNVTAAATLANTTVTAGTYGNSTTVPVISVDAKGRVTGVVNTALSLSTGYTGSAGAGYTGSQGIQGVTGYTGSAGANGTNGSQGAVGYTGSAGTNGTAGSQGAIGYTGSKGVATASDITTILGYTPPQPTGTGASGNWAINITGQSGAASTVSAPDGDRNAASKLPTTTTHAVRYDFCTAGSAGTAGNYAGVMTYAPWDGATASTGDASYQMAFGSTAANGGGVPMLNIRKGIDASWNSWYTLLHSGASGQVTSLGVGTAASGTAGTILATGDITAYYSDDRLKTRLGEVTGAVDKVMTLDAFYYEANEIAQSLGYQPVREVGVSAQQVQAVLPEVVAPAPIDDTYLTVRYERLVPLLIAAIKEQQQEINELRDLITKQQA